MANRAPEILATFEDKYGDKRTIHRVFMGGCARVRVKRIRSTPVQVLTDACGKTVGRNIARLRIERGMSMAELARRATLLGGKQRVYSLEHNTDRGGLRLGTLYAVAAALEVEPSSLLPPLEDAMKDCGACMVDNGAFQCLVIIHPDEED